MSWVKIEDKMADIRDNIPTIREEVLISDSNDVYIGFLGLDLRFYMISDGEYQPCESLNFYVTHWMPLPSPPKDK